MRPLVLLLALSWLMHAATALGGDPAAHALLGVGYLALASVLAGTIADRLGLPKLAGYLLVGFIAGPVGFALAIALGLAATALDAAPVRAIVLSRRPRRRRILA